MKNEADLEGFDRRRRFRARLLLASFVVYFILTAGILWLALE